MIDFSTLNFANIVGWRQHYDGSITESITTSLSGLFVQDAHHYCNYETIKALTDDYVFPTWAAGTYKKGQIVTHSSIHYRALEATTAATSDSTKWEVYDKVSNTIKDWIAAASVETVQEFYFQKFMVGSMKDLLKTSFPINQYGTSLVPNVSAIAGIVITPAKSTMQKMKIDGVNLYFSANATVTIKLYKGTKTTPEVTQVVTYVKNTPYTALTGFTMEPGFPYYLCYVQTDIANAYGDDVDQDYLPTEYLSMNGNYAIQGFRNSDAGFDRQFDVYEKVSHGISPLISVWCDYTAFFNTNKLSFAQAINIKTAIIILNAILSNPNAKVNRYIEVAKDGRLQYEIDGDPTGYKSNNMGLKAKYEKALNSIVMDTSSIDKVCLTCQSPKIRRGSI